MSPRWFMPSSYEWMPRAASSLWASIRRMFFSQMVLRIASSPYHENINKTQLSIIQLAIRVFFGPYAHSLHSATELVHIDTKWWRWKVVRKIFIVNSLQSLRSLITVCEEWCFKAGCSRGKSAVLCFLLRNVLTVNCGGHTSWSSEAQTLSCKVKLAYSTEILVFLTAWLITLYCKNKEVDILNGGFSSHVSCFSCLQGIITKHLKGEQHIQKLSTIVCKLLT